MSDMTAEERAQMRTDDRPLSVGEQIVDDYMEKVIAQPWQLADRIDRTIRQAEAAGRKAGLEEAKIKIADWLGVLGYKDASEAVRALAESEKPPTAAEVHGILKDEKP